MDDDAIDQTAAAEYDLVLFADSVMPSNVGSEFAELAVPVLTAQTAVLSRCARGRIVLPYAGVHSTPALLVRTGTGHCRRDSSPLCEAGVQPNELPRRPSREPPPQAPRTHVCM